MIITSKENKKIKDIKKLIKSRKVRDLERRFICEGTRIVREATPGIVSEIIYSASFGKKEPEFLKELGLKHERVSFQEVSDDVFESMSDTKTPQGIMAICCKASLTLKDLIDSGENRLFVVLENIQDPGNLGTIVRTSEACAVTAVILTEGCADYYSPKVIRSTMGTVFRVPVIEKADVDDVIGLLRANGITTYAADLKRSNSLFEEQFSPETAIFIGNEGNGLNTSTVDACDRSIRIPMSGKVESLNASVAASVMLYEIKRQRGLKI